MEIFRFVCLLIAVVLFAAATFVHPRSAQALAAGLTFFALAFLVPAARAL